jgi:hypothetical protein
MEDDAQTPLTLSREDLYELAWSKPMSELAKDFGISDVALAKRCKRLGIPVPGRGYWARVDAGQTPHRPKLPKREPQWHDQSALTVAPASEPNLASLTEGVGAAEGVDSIRARIAAVTITPILSILEALPAVKRSALRLKHPQRAQLAFNRGEKSGPLVAMQVTDEALDRALLLADTLLRAADSLGWAFIVPAPSPSPEETAGRSHPASAEKPRAEPPIGRLLVDGEHVAFRIEERLRDEPREPTACELAREKREYGYHAVRKVQVPTGKLRAVRLDTYRTYGEPDRRTWYDRKGHRVEDQLRDILQGFCELSLSIKARRAEDERKERERQEEERRRQEREARQEANAKLIKQLETDAGAWHRARYLRRYIQAARKRLGEHPLRAAFLNETINFLDWAEQYVNQLDPLHALPRSDEFERDRVGYHHVEIEQLKKSFARLLGSDWENAWKLGKDYSPPPKSERHWYCGEKSVFEVDVPPEAGSNPE